MFTNNEPDIPFKYVLYRRHAGNKCDNCSYFTGLEDKDSYVSYSFCPKNFRTFCGKRFIIFKEFINLRYGFKHHDKARNYVEYPFIKWALEQE